MTAIQAINESYRHIIEKDLKGITTGYVESEELYVILEGPRLSNRGSKNIFKGWGDFCDSPVILESIEWTEGPYFEEMKEMAWVGGVVDLTVNVKGKQFTRTFRSTFVLTKVEGEWKIKHEHVSAAHEDPYGIGDWLKK